MAEIVIILGMDESFLIYVDRLRDGQDEFIEETFAPDFLKVEEKDLSFNEPVQVKGKAYLAGHELLLELSVWTKALMPCAICNELALVLLGSGQVLHVEPIEEIKHGIFDIRPVIRSAILLEVPLVTECNGRCPQRERLKLYLKKEDHPRGQSLFDD